jgi:hypothetical protein
MYKTYQEILDGWRGKHKISREIWVRDQIGLLPGLQVGYTV